MDDINRIDIAEFKEEGFLQEVNRLFFHPMGLALEVVVDEEGNEKLGGIWDYRDDPEGIIFNAKLSEEKAQNVRDEYAKHVQPRLELMGEVHQSIEE